MQKWLKDRHDTIVKRTQVLVNRQLDPEELTLRMAEYAGDYAYLVAETVEATREYQIEKLAYEEWYAGRYRQLTRTKKFSTNKQADAALMETYADEYKEANLRVINAEAQKAAFDGWLNVYRQLKDIYVELARGQRDEIHRQDVSVGKSGVEKYNRTKSKTTGRRVK